MEIKPQYGFDQLLFGMKKQDVERLYGKPDLIFDDEDDNTIVLYNSLKCRLTFYADEDFKLGYIIVSNPEATLWGQKILGSPFSDWKFIFDKKGLQKFEIERLDSVIHYFNEDNWLLIQEEFAQICKVEIGAIVKDIDTFDWKFK